MPDIKTQRAVLDNVLLYLNHAGGLAQNLKNIVQHSFENAYNNEYVSTAGSGDVLGEIGTFLTYKAHDTRKKLDNLLTAYYRENVDMGVYIIGYHISAAEETRSAGLHYADQIELALEGQISSIFPYQIPKYEKYNPDPLPLPNGYLGDDEISVPKFDIWRGAWMTLGAVKSSLGWVLDPYSFVEDVLVETGLDLAEEDMRAAGMKETTIGSVTSVLDKGISIYRFNPDFSDPLGAIHNALDGGFLIDKLTGQPSASYSSSGYYEVIAQPTQSYSMETSLVYNGSSVSVATVATPQPTIPSPAPNGGGTCSAAWPAVTTSNRSGFSDGSAFAGGGGGGGGGFSR